MKKTLILSLILSAISTNLFSMNNNADEIKTCMICFEVMNNDDLQNPVTTLPIQDNYCGHMFHTECIKQCLEHSNLCPICRTRVLSHLIIQISGIQNLEIEEACGF